jgi:hypothetical protein
LACRRIRSLHMNVDAVRIASRRPTMSQILGSDGQA